jgi:hypothetical protein
MLMQLMSRLSPVELLPILVLSVLGLTGVLIAVPAILAAQWRLHRKSQGLIQLKREMVRRGMSAGEIERVIRATGVPELVQHGFSTKAIERLTRAGGPSGDQDPPHGGDRVVAGLATKGAPLDPEF